MYKEYNAEIKTAEPHIAARPVWSGQYFCEVQFQSGKCLRSVA